MKAICDCRSEGESKTCPKHGSETKPQHTPTPWHSELSTVYGPTNQKELHSGTEFDKEPEIICSVINKPDAAFIVRAVNSHEELLEAMRCAIRQLATIEDGQSSLMAECVADDLKQAIAKAEGCDCDGSTGYDCALHGRGK